MVVSEARKPVVDAVLIGVDRRPLCHVLTDQGLDGLALDVRHDEGLDLAATLDDTNDRRLVLGSSCGDLPASVGVVHILGLPAHVRLVNLHRTRERAQVLFELLADEAAHPPCRLVGDADLALDLLCGDSLAGRGHEVDGMEPERERRGALVKDGPSGGVNMVAALLA